MDQRPLALTVACFLWDGEPADRRTRYGVHHVHVLRSMCARHLPPHRFVCLADRDVPDVETHRIDHDALKWGKRYPKLLLWRGDMAATLGHRALYLDLDCVVVGNLATLVDRDEDVVLWRDPGKRARYNTSLVLFRPGRHPEIWDGFRPGWHHRGARGPGTDQAWVGRVLGSGVATWGPEDGVYSYKRDLKQGDLPSDARVVFFHGTPKPWEVSNPWVRRHWR